MPFETTWAVLPDHPAFAGHFPGAPILPGVLLLDAVLLWAETVTDSVAGSIGNAKFLSPVRPGEVLTLALEYTKPGSARFDIACGSRKVATGQLALTARAQP
jgi:3-hydroxymyristoyl/3-hydroxydecanoyl-(acyl carrier protein) dehydratase